MQTLLDRSDRMAMYNGFELRVPFCDYRLAQYVWNIPWEIKALKGREKGLLRYICKDFLPAEIVDRKNRLTLRLIILLIWLRLRVCLVKL